MGFFSWAFLLLLFFMKTAGQIDGLVSFTGGQFALCLALNEPPAHEQSVKLLQRATDFLTQVPLRDVSTSNSTVTRNLFHIVTHQ